MFPLQLKMAIVHIFVLFCLIPGSLGNRNREIKASLLKLRVSLAIARECKNRENLAHQLKAPLKHILKQASTSERNALEPDPEYALAIAKAACVSGNYGEALRSVDQDNYGSVQYRELEPTGDYTSDLVDTEVAEENVGLSSQSYHLSISVLISFAIGAVVGSVLTHYFLLVKITPVSIGPTKIMRRPEL